MYLVVTYFIYIYFFVTQPRRRDLIEGPHTHEKTTNSSGKKAHTHEKKAHTRGKNPSHAERVTYPGFKPWTARWELPLLITQVRSRSNYYSGSRLNLLYLHHSLCCCQWWNQGGAGRGHDPSKILETPYIL